MLELSFIYMKFNYDNFPSNTPKPLDTIEVINPSENLHQELETTQNIEELEEIQRRTLIREAQKGDTGALEELIEKNAGLVG